MITPLNPTLRRLRRPAIGLALLLASALLSSSLGLATPLVSADDSDLLIEDAGQIDISRPSGCPSACKVSSLSHAQPAFILAGETSTITLPIHATCSEEPIREHIVIVVDPSPALDDRDMNQVKLAIREFAAQLNFGQDTRIEIGLVQAGNRSRSLVPLTSDDTLLEKAPESTGRQRFQQLRGGFEESQVPLRDPPSS